MCPHFLCPAVLSIVVAQGEFPAAFEGGNKIRELVPKQLWCLENQHVARIIVKQNNKTNEECWFILGLNEMVSAGWGRCGGGLWLAGSLSRKISGAVFLSYFENHELSFSGSRCLWQPGAEWSRGNHTLITILEPGPLQRRKGAKPKQSQIGGGSQIDADMYSMADSLSMAGGVTL